MIAGSGQIMSPYLVIFVYGVAVVLAVVLLYEFESIAWYWHGTALALSLLAGFMPPLGSFSGAVADLLTGFAVIFLMFWGLGGLLLKMAPHRHKHA